MIEFPLILIGYALLPLIAIKLMILADQRYRNGRLSGQRARNTMNDCYSHK